MQVKQYRLAVLTLVIFVFNATSAFSWPFGSNKKKTESKPVGSSQGPVHLIPVASAKSSSSVKSQSSENFFDSSKEEDGAEAPLVPEIPQIPQNKISLAVPKIPSIPGAPSAASAKGPSYAGDDEIVRIQKQIREIIKINDSLKTNFSGQAAQLQKISEQAKIHEKILNDLEKSKELARGATAESYLNQEKVRIIDKQTKENQKFLEGLKKKKEISALGNGQPDAAAAAADTVSKV